MLEKNDFFYYCDSHLHLADLPGEESFSFPEHYAFCSSCQNETEWKKEMLFLEKNPGLQKKSVLAFGVHPMNPDENNLSFLDELLKNRKISSVGEIGFDLFTPEGKNSLLQQKKIFHQQLLLASFYQVPVILHIRKGLDFIFEETSLLKKIPSVIFHSYSEGMMVSESLLKRGVNAYFSFGKQLLNGNKKQLEAAAMIPFERLLLETDAPFGKLKGQKITVPEEIISVYQKAFSLRKDFSLLSDMAFSVQSNFFKIFSIVE